MRSIREEFEKAFDHYWDSKKHNNTGEAAALWAAKWALEKAAEIAIKTVESKDGRYYGDQLTAKTIADEIKQAAESGGGA